MPEEPVPALDLEGSRGIMVLLEKHVHLQKEVGAGWWRLLIRYPRVKVWGLELRVRSGAELVA